jgi:glycosyltransferase involved in cell wall biosynthesis
MMMTETPLRYSCVIVTRNRHDALRLSLPAMLRQTRLPLEIFVVDSSDDKDATRAILDDLRTTSPVPMTYVDSPPGMTVQRNIGLGLVSGEVVLFPDDDSLLYPNAMVHIMRVYERDREGLIGGVCAAEAHEAHETAGLGGSAAGAAKPYARKRSDALALVMMPLRRKFEARFLPDPFLTLADVKYRSLTKPGWLAEENAILVPYMTGFRMSYRTEVIRRLRFDEGLGRYALFEDIDASLRVLDTHCLAAASDAWIYHHKAPERRDGGQAMGAMHILNRAYVLTKDRTADSKAWAMICGEARRYAGYKTWLYRLRAKPGFPRDRLRGAELASKGQQEILTAPSDRLAEVYQAVKERCLRPVG